VIAAGIFVFTLERAIYYYGASSSKSMDRNIFSPYLLQWEMMKLAKSKNI
jgi:lipid II:glycine glycyltransferase (peptidoglycan interpeptide bridge formation enzyme)